MAVTVRKVSIAIGHEELAWARKRAKRERTSLSAVLTDAAREARASEARRERQRAAWAELYDWATHGKGFTADELDAARRELDDA